MTIEKTKAAEVAGLMAGSYSEETRVEVVAIVSDLQNRLTTCNEAAISNLATHFEREEELEAEIKLLKTKAAAYDRALLHLEKPPPLLGGA